VRGVDFNHATLSQVNFTGADLRGANLWLPDGWQGLCLRDAQFDGQKLNYWNFAGCDLRGIICATRNSQRRSCGV
jgi:uncharacterized protein YjbI with pentapeptide repeats